MTSLIEEPQTIDPPEVPRPQPAYATPALVALLLITGVSYLADLGRNGWGNTFYAAAVQAGVKSWKAFFFGSFDAGNFITVDKPPVSLWIMSLSGRIFGFNSWSMLVPQALLGVASVALLYAAVRRVWGVPAALLAGGALAATPVAALMFRFNNPDAALTTLLIAAAYAITRALEGARLRWLVAGGLLLGTAFLAKELQALLVLPGFVVAYFVAAPVSLWKRTWQLLVAGVSLIASGLWWPLLVDAIPAGSRPYIGGSTTNNVIQLALGYNGLGRVTGNESSGGGPSRAADFVPGGDLPAGAERFLAGRGGGGGGAGFGGSTGLLRMANTEFGGLIGWLLPAAILGLLVGLWLTRRTARTNLQRAGLLLWGGWLVVTVAVLSFASGIIHPYYTVALAPAVAVLASVTLPTLWRHRDVLGYRIAMAVLTACTAATAYRLLDRAPTWLPWLRWTVLGVGLIAALALLIVTGLSRRFGRTAAAGIAVAALASGLAAPLAWSADTIGTSHTGPTPTAGPNLAGGMGFPGARLGQLGRGQFPEGFPGGGQLPSGSPEAGQAPGGGQSSPAGGQGLPSGRQAPPGAGRGLPGGNDSGQVNAAMVSLLKQGAGGYRWVAAASSSMTAGPLELASGQSVMSLGGFSGSDPAITLATFKSYVSAGKVHYYVAGGFSGPGGFGGAGGPGGDRSGSAAIATWVSSAFTSSTVGGYTVYDLSTAKTAQ